MSEITVSVLTGPGRAAIHTILLSGHGSRSIVDQVFRGQGLSPHGNVVDSQGEVIDDVILLDWPGEIPRYLFTLHGSPLIRDRVFERLVEQGASVVENPLSLWSPTESSWRRKIREEALRALPQAASSQVCAFLLEQASAVGFSGWFEKACTDGVVRSEVEELLQRFRLGIGMLQAPRVVLAGEPNAGKSTLFNTLLGQERVLTAAEAGTTRDLIAGEVCFTGFPVELVDGAGLRDAPGEIEQEGVRRMKAAMDQADLVVYLVPPGGRVPLAGQNGTPLERTLVIHSRRDEADSGSVVDLGISAISGEGLPALQEAILEGLYGHDRNPGGKVCPFLPQHKDLLEAIRSTLDAGEDPRQLLREYGAREMGDARC